MYCQLLAVAALVASVVASPAPLEKRATCTLPPTTTVTVSGTGYPILGPFKVTASTSPTPTNAFNGAYLKITSGTYEQGVFNGKPVNAALMYLDPSTHYLYNLQGQTPFAGCFGSYNTQQHVVFTEGLTCSTQPVTCTINPQSCALNCNFGANSYNQLESPTFQPDWSIVSGPKAAGKGKGNAIPFTPYIVPA
ncbi:hypothetical protein BDY17DRAFT_297538 [Neohortaea acidophila]|uniref:Uncharacterized protein n=1 Tax=Neohortaea acidophila TaxID=245834 RepID=A0A6A6PW46_9PEZI|nr:uncharacterized protein BDY17DRAFT_297538 [Neohortaea acidophila]KAF2483517.1 hypothetical protein BDY17DRAFT_297538 [Neohortaea acidophila]